MKALEIKTLSSTRREITIPEIQDQLNPDFANEIDAYMREKHYSREQKVVVSGMCEETYYYHGGYRYYIGTFHLDMERHEVTFELVRG